MHPCIALRMLPLENIFVYLSMCYVMLICHNSIKWICRFVCILLNIKKSFFFLNIYDRAHETNLGGNWKWGWRGYPNNNLPNQGINGYGQGLRKVIFNQNPKHRGIGIVCRLDRYPIVILVCPIDVLCQPIVGKFSGGFRYAFVQ